AVALGRVETNLLRGALRGLIQSMPQAPDNSLNSYFAGCSEHDFQKYLAFDVEFAGLIGVDRPWFKLNFHRCRLRFGLGPCPGRGTGGSYFTKAALGHRSFAAMIAGARSGNAITKPGTGYRAAHSARATGPVSISGTCRQIK